MWLYAVCFIFCTIVNPTVPVAWLCFLVTQFACAWLSVCVCVCVKSFILFFIEHRWFMAWVCLGAIVCAYTQFSWTLWQLWQNTDTLREWKRQRFIVSSVFFIFFFMFSILWVGLRHGVAKVKNKKKSCCSFLDNIILSNIRFEVCNICMCVWKLCKFVIVCTFCIWVYVS